MSIIVEIGANRGIDTANFLSDPENKVFAFEPTPELYLQLKEKFKNCENYYPMPFAVDIENGWTWFNIAGTSDWGCSSIHEFNPNIHQEWEGRPDFKFTDRCRVPTVRLDTFMDVYGVNEIDYLWIDAQGNDFRVLKSLGEYIHKVKRGRCEVADTVNLYTNVDNTSSSVSEYLMHRGFDCLFDKVNGKEADIHFEKKNFNSP